MGVARLRKGLRHVIMSWRMDLGLRDRLGPDLVVLSQRDGTRGAGAKLFALIRPE